MSTTLDTMSLAAVKRQLAEAEKRKQDFHAQGYPFHNDVYFEREPEAVDAACTHYQRIMDFLSALSSSERAAIETFLTLTSDTENWSPEDRAARFYLTYRKEGTPYPESGEALRTSVIIPYTEWHRQYAALSDEVFHLHAVARALRKKAKEAKELRKSAAA